jgi:hypothetical protein
MVAKGLMGLGSWRRGRDRSVVDMMRYVMIPEG